MSVVKTKLGWVAAILLAGATGVRADEIPFYLIHQSINFMTADDVRKLLLTVNSVHKRSGQPIAMTVVDTVSRTGDHSLRARWISQDEIGRLVDEVRDRYGAPSDSILNLAEYARIRILADSIGLDSVERDGKIVMLKFRPDATLDPKLLFSVVKSRGDLLLLPPAILKLDLNRPADPPETAPAGPLRPKPGGPPPRRKAPPSTTTSWWTTRARAGEVTPGFRREVILAPGALDPRVPGGLFDRLGDVLVELSRGVRAS